MSAASTLGQGAINTLNNVGCYFAGNSVLIPPALGTVGNARRNIFPDLGFKDWDLSLLKETKIKERMTVEFRAEFFNILNHANFQSPLPFSSGNNAQIFNSDGTPSGAGGLSQPLLVLPRDIQFALKVIW